MRPTTKTTTKTNDPLSVRARIVSSSNLSRHLGITCPDPSGNENARSKFASLAVGNRSSPHCQFERSREPLIYMHNVRANNPGEKLTSVLQLLDSPEVSGQAATIDVFTQTPVYQ